MQDTAERGLDWVQRIGVGDRAAESELVAHYLRGVRLILLQRTGSPDLANDLAQDTFVVVLRRLRAGELHKPESLAAFIRQTAINHSIQHFRKEKRYVSGEDGIIDLHLTHKEKHSAELDGEAMRLLLNEALGQLAVDRDRDILTRFYLRDEDKTDICRALDLSPSHFDRVLYRAKQRMRELIDSQKGLKAMLFGGLLDV